MEYFKNDAHRSDLLPILLSTGPIRILDLGIRYHDRLAECLHEMKELEDAGDIEVHGSKEAFQNIVENVGAYHDNGANPPQKFFRIVESVPGGEELTISLTRKGFRAASS